MPLVCFRSLIFMTDAVTKILFQVIDAERCPQGLQTMTEGFYALLDQR